MLSLDYQLPPGDSLDKYQQRQLHKQCPSPSASPQLQHQHHQRQQSAPEDLLPHHRLLEARHQHKRHSLNTSLSQDTAAGSPQPHSGTELSGCNFNTAPSEGTPVSDTSSFVRTTVSRSLTTGRRKEAAGSSSDSEQVLQDTASLNNSISDSDRANFPNHSSQRRPFSSDSDYSTYLYGYRQLTVTSHPCGEPAKDKTVTTASNRIGDSSYAGRGVTIPHTEKTFSSQHFITLSKTPPSSETNHCSPATEIGTPRITLITASGSSSSSSATSSVSKEPPGQSLTVTYLDQSSGRPGYLQSKSWPPVSEASMSKGVRSPHLLCVVEAEDDLSDWESPVDVDLADPPVRQKRQSSWRKIRSFILWSPFIQVFKKHRYPWIQLAGHQGNFHAGEAGSVLKKMDARERSCFQKLMADSLKEHAPEYRGDVEKNGETYIQLQDLLCSFSQPCVMDVKMGVRTYLEDELHKARRSPTLRKDMYQKMVEIDTSAPTPEENEQKAVTKPRYMQWRDEMSSSVELGFRVEGIKKSDGNSSKDFKKTKTRDNIVDILKSFVGDNENIVTKYLWKLKEIMRAQEGSEFFSSHEVIGSSLLFVHDTEENVGVWMIDFGKTEPLPKGVKIDHRSKWIEGNHEDGYLFGLDNLVSIFEEVQQGLTSSAV